MRAMPAMVPAVIQLKHMMENTMTEENSNCQNSDSCADAKAVVLLVIIAVTTACFWLLGR